MKKLTINQEKAINTLNKNLLVSASAGSGKTMVLISRIVKIIEDEKIPIKRMLVVTFTKTAAQEMKQKLVSELAKKSDDDFIFQQIEDIALSDISTIDSFCIKLLKKYFYAISLDPNFKILNQQQEAELKNRAIDEVLSELFNNNDEVFLDLYSFHNKGRTEEGLKNIIFNIYNHLQKTDKSFLETHASSYLEDLPSNNAVMIFNEYLIKSFAVIGEIFENLLSEGIKLNDFKLNELLFKLKAQISSINSQNKNPLINFDILIQMQPCLLGRTKISDLEYKERLKNFIDNFKTEVKKLKEFLPLEDVKELSKNIKQSKVYSNKLLEITDKFSERYCFLKSKEGVLDMQDGEALTIQILENEQVRKDIQNTYKYIFIDEYQDTNYIQEKIFSKISQKNNLFLVGDAKQSIYGFRLTSPEIFNAKYKIFQKDMLNNEKVDLNENFRSNSNILKFINSVFEKNMTNEFGGI